MQKTSVRKVGNSLGITLPKTIVDNYQLAEGDELNLVEARDGIILTPFNPEFTGWVEAYEKANKKYRNVLRKLAE